jgi:hypothetical protein
VAVGDGWTEVRALVLGLEVGGGLRRRAGDRRQMSVRVFGQNHVGVLVEVLERSSVDRPRQRRQPATGPRLDELA